MIRLLQIRSASSSPSDAWPLDAERCSLVDRVPEHLEDGLLLVRTDDGSTDALLSEASRTVRMRTVLVGYETDLARGSRRVGPRLGRLVDFELAGAISPRGAFVGPKVLLHAMRASCILGLQCASYCEWAGIVHASLSEFLARYADAVDGFLSDASATYITASEIWQQPGKWGPLPVLCLLPGVDLDAFALAAQPTLRGIDVVVTSSLDAPPPAAAYLGTGETLARLAACGPVPVALRGRIIPIGEVSPSPDVSHALVEGADRIDAVEVEAIARAVSPIVRLLHARAPEPIATS